MSGKIILSLVLAAGGLAVFVTTAEFGWRNLHLVLFYSAGEHCPGWSCWSWPGLG